MITTHAGCWPRSQTARPPGARSTSNAAFFSRWNLKKTFKLMYVADQHRSLPLPQRLLAQQLPRRPARGRAAGVCHDRRGAPVRRIQHARKSLRHLTSGPAATALTPLTRARRLLESGTRDRHRTPTPQPAAASRLSWATTRAWKTTGHTASTLTPVVRELREFLALTSTMILRASPSCPPARPTPRRTTARTRRCSTAGRPRG